MKGYCISLVIRQYFLSFQNNAKNLESFLQDGSRSLGLFRKGKTRIIAKFHRNDLVICSHSRERKIPSFSQICTIHCDILFDPFCATILTMTHCIV